MFTKNTKKSFILVFALLACAILLFAACNPTNAFTPVELPAAAEAVGNGGIAVRYGEWIYYVNGYQSSATADNAYTNDIRTGAIVRVKVADLDDIIKINDQDLSTSKKAEAIKKAVAEKTQMVVPNFYYTGNTSTTAINGINIFGDRIYITTPNNALDANGNILSSQLVLASYKLDGSDMQRHFVFASNAPQLKLTQDGQNVVATYILDNQIKTFSFKAGETVSENDVKVITEEKISSPVLSGNNVYFLDNNGSICRYTVGGTEYKVLVEKVVEEGHEDHSHGESYTIKSANGDYVYYTNSDSSSQTAGLQLYYATVKNGEVVKDVALDTIPTGSYFGWGEKVVYTTSVPEESVTMYGIWVASKDGADKVEILNPAENDKTITFNRLDGDVLYYTVDSVSYTLNLTEKLANENTPAVAYAYNLSFSATGWATPDVLDNYVFSLSSGAVSVVKFNPETKRNSASTAITLTVIEESAE